MEGMIANAIVAALAAASASLSEVAKKVVLDSYEGLKSLLRKKLGDTSEAVQSVERLEKKPARDDLQSTVAQELTEAEADKDPELAEAARRLLEKVQTEPGVASHIQSAVGNYIAQADRGAKASVNLGVGWAQWTR